MSGPRTSQSFSGAIPVRFEGAPDGPLAFQSKWRGVKDFEHATLCRALSLDPNRFYFDLPSTCRGVGSSSGAHLAKRGTVDGYVFMTGFDRPVAKLRVCFDSEKLWDCDPMSRRDFEDLSHS